MVFGGDAGAQLFQRAVEDFAGGRLLDELDQWFDRFGILDTSRALWAPRRSVRQRASKRCGSLALPGLAQRLPGRGNTRDY